jgi:hypothetical protein
MGAGNGGSLRSRAGLGFRAAAHCCCVRRTATHILFPGVFMVWHPEFSQERLASPLGRSRRMLMLAALRLAGCGSETPTDTTGSSGRAFTVRPARSSRFGSRAIGPGGYRFPRKQLLECHHIPRHQAGNAACSCRPHATLRFQTIAPGRAIVVFQHSEQSSTVVDTGDVQ